MIKVSIIIGIYNKEKYLNESIESAINQTMPSSEYEIILVNNGSTDNSRNIAKRYCDENENIILIDQENRLISGGLNSGLNIAKGKYVYELDADDIMQNNLLEICYKISEENKLDFLHFGFEFLHCFGENFDNKLPTADKQKEVFKSIPNNKVITGIDFFKSNMWSGCLFTYFFNSRFLTANNLFFDETIPIADTEFIPRLCMKAKRIMHIRKVLYKYRISEINLSHEVYIKREYLNSDQITLYKFCDLVKENINSDNELTFSFKRFYLHILIEMINKMKGIKGIDIKRIFQIEINEFMNKYLELFGCYVENDLEQLNEIVNLFDEIMKNDMQLYKIDKNIEEFIFNIKLNKLEIEEEKKRKEKERMENERVRLLLRIPFQEKDKKIAIYGIGSHTERMIQCYKTNLGEIKGKVYFIDSYKGNNGEKFLGQEIINVKNINKYEFNCIVISSASYENEILSNVTKILKYNIPIYTFYQGESNIYYDILF